MAEIKTPVNDGLFPDGFFGVRGWRRNQELIQNYAQSIFGDVETRAALDSLGKLGAVENLVEQGMRAATREEQKPYIQQLANVVDAIGTYEYQQSEATRIDQRLSESVMSAASFIDVTQREQLAQIADGLYRAKERSEFDPSTAIEQMEGLETELRALTQQAGERLNNQFIEPLRTHEFNIASTMQQLRDIGGRNLEDNMDPSLVTQVLDLAGAQLQASGEGKFSFNFKGLGWTPSQLPDMTYADGIRRLESALVGAQRYVNSELERRGAPAIMQTQRTLAAGQGQRNKQAAINEALAQTLDVPQEDVSDYSDDEQQNAFTQWMSGKPAGTTFDEQAMQAVLPDGTRHNPPPSARALIDQLRRRRGRTERLPTNEH